MKDQKEMTAKEVALQDMKKGKAPKKEVAKEVSKAIKKATAAKAAAPKKEVSKAKESFKKEVAAKEDKVSAIYKDEVYADLAPKQRKSFRMKVRRMRNTFAKNIIATSKKKDQKELQDEVKGFISFYKENYKVNDFTVSSLSAKNNDDDTEDLLTQMLSIIKVKKVKA